MTLVSRIAAYLYNLPPRKSAKICIESNIQVTMRDGITLLADRWYAKGYENAPVVLMRSPYGRTGMFAIIARLFAERGFQFVLQSCRGTFGSGGVFDPMRQEREDGLDTLAWIRAQPWFSRRVYTFGGSYVGYVQWAIAGAAGDDIDGMALQVTLSNFRDETLAFGGFTLAGSLQWTIFMSKLAVPGSFWARFLQLRPQANLAKIHMHLPLKDLDRLATDKEVSWWQDWVGHDEPSDPWWRKVDHSVDVGGIKAPAVMIGGWRDIFLPSQVKDFEAMQANGRDAWLTIGPWFHASLAGVAEGVREAVELFRAHGEGRPAFADRDRVRLYIVGANEWRNYPSWPPPGSHQAGLYLQPGANLGVAAPSTSSDPSVFIYDPQEPTPSVHGPKLMGGKKKPDMAQLERRGDTIAFTSAPLSADLEAIGPVSLELFVRSDRQHTDFCACLCDVDRKGRALHVVDGYLRLRPGDVPQSEDGVRLIRIDCWPTAYRFRRGHQLRVIIASGAHPRYARNLGTGEPLATATRMVTAHQEVFHDQARPSAIYLTVAHALNNVI